MMQGITLRGLVISRFGSIEKFAQYMKWSKSKAYRVLSGSQDIGIDEIPPMADALGLKTPEEVVSIFLPTCSQTEQKEHTT